MVSAAGRKGLSKPTSSRVQREYDARHDSKDNTVHDLDDGIDEAMDRSESLHGDSAEED